MSDYHKAYYRKNREKLIEKSKIWYQEHKKKPEAYRQEHDEKVREYHRAYYRKHREEIKEKAKIYHQEHLEELRDYARAYYRKNRKEIIEKSKIYQKELRKFYQELSPEEKKCNKNLHRKLAAKKRKAEGFALLQEELISLKDVADFDTVKQIDILLENYDNMSERDVKRCVKEIFKGNRI